MSMNRLSLQIVRHTTKAIDMVSPTAKPSRQEFAASVQIMYAIQGAKVSR
jgi:hypothetical protein